MHEIRNIAFTGQSGGGKTTLAEKLLMESGNINSCGDVEHGSTVSDFLDQEKTEGHSLETSLIGIAFKKKRIQLLDTPGAADFSGRAMSILPAVETVAVVIDASEGIDILTERMMDISLKRQKCRMIIINKIDKAPELLESLVSDIQERFGNECLPVNLPSDNGNSVVDCYFKPDYDAAVDFADVQQIHDALIDQVVEVDEELMALYLEQGEELNPEQLHDPLEQCLREQHLVPICFTSAKNGAGISLLLDTLINVMPDPSEGNPPLYLKGQKPAVVVPDAERHLLAHVFKVSIDPFMGRLAYIRIHQGTLRPDTQLFIGDSRKAFKANHLYSINGKNRKEIQQAKPGDICAIAKIDDLQFDHVIHDNHEEDMFHLKTIEFPPAMYGLTLEPVRTGDEQKMSDSLKKLCDEDPSLQLVHKATLNETVLQGLGEIHLKIALEKLSTQFHLEVTTDQPSIDYRESITQPATATYRHKKQSGGSGQFGEVQIKIRPKERGTGFEFINKIVGGVIPGQYIPGVEKGIIQAMEEGVIAGFPMQDIEVTLFDGKHHSVDSKEIAFFTAAKKAFQIASQEAKPVILEPIVEVEVQCASDLMGDITGDIASHRGMITNTIAQSGNKVLITATVPQAEMRDYVARMKSITSGEGSFRLEFSHYDPVPTVVQQSFKKKQFENDE